VAVSIGRSLGFSLLRVKGLSTAHVDWNGSHSTGTSLRSCAPRFALLYTPHFIVEAFRLDHIEMTVDTKHGTKALSGQRRALVTGAGGFIGGHLVDRLKAEGFWVRGIGRKAQTYRPSAADEFLVLDLRQPEACARAFEGAHFDHVYQLAASMGGMDYIEAAECDIMRDSVRIDVNMIEAAVQAKAGRFFYSSSVCVYRDMLPGENALTEEDAYPAQPDNEYGWEKLYAERLMLAFARRGLLNVRIGRFENTYGPYGAWRGGREKAVSALCRKVAEIPAHGTIDVYGDGTAIRAFTYVADLIDGIRILMESDSSEPTNVGTDEYVSIAQLIEIIADVAEKPFSVRYIPGPTGVTSRNFSKARIQALGYRDHHSLRDGVALTYVWISEQVKALATTPAKN
jgi:GDP-D-mannose 3',5'-epimerase